MILIGTSGYSFQDWRGTFYPEDIEDGRMLDYYKKFFNAVEINSTYYRIPSATVFYHLDRKHRLTFISSSRFTNKQPTSAKETAKRWNPF
jgi:uncharacterized protein YecE (DUF72 family)